MRLILYALGKFFHDNVDRIPWEDVIGVSDKDICLSADVHNKPFLEREQLVNLEYDYVVVFSDKYYQEIRAELYHQYFIPKWKIVPWQTLIEVENDEYELIKMYDEMVKAMDLHTVLNVSSDIFEKYYFTRQRLFRKHDVQLEAVINRKQGEQVYDRVYKSTDEIDKTYDVILVNDNLKFWKSYGRYIFVYQWFHVSNPISLEQLVQNFKEYGAIAVYQKCNLLFAVIESEKVKAEKDIAVYVVSHKKYNVCKEFMYTTITVGNYHEEGCISETSGDNIAYLNSKINECTALYWIWKNSTAKYVGVNHYRRYIYNNDYICMDNYLSYDVASKIFDEYEVIVGEATQLYGITVEEQLQKTVNLQAYETGKSIVLDWLSRKQPEYIDAFKDVFAGHKAYYCNLMIARKDILDRYCEWLFSFIIDAAEEINVEEYDNYSKRIIGFFAERMFTVWLCKQNLKVKELPYVKTEK